MTTPPYDLSAFTGWKRSLADRWIELGADQLLAAINVDFEKEFLTTLAACSASSDPYAEYEWVIFKHHAIQPGVLHAAPLKVAEEPTLWEEWFFVDNEMHHHELRNHPHAGEEHQWMGNDNEHPEVVLDVQWHYINDTDLRPYLLR
jgi:hypothetical protein